MMTFAQRWPRINYCWRVFATGFCFSVFGIGGLIIGLLVTPYLYLRSRNPATRQQIAQRIIQRCFFGFVQLMRNMGLLTYEVEGLAALRQSRQELVIANHPTLIDVVLLIGFMQNANCVVKQALWRNPFTRGPVTAARYVLNDNSERCIATCVERLQEAGAASLVIFPEGTRTERGQSLNEFQRGAANIAIRARVPIRPVLISCQPSTLTKNEKWYQIPERPIHLRIKVLDAILLSDVLPDSDVTPMNVRRLNHYLHQFYQRELAKL